MNRQDFADWLDTTLVDTFPIGENACSIKRQAGKLIADAAYNLLSKEISENDEEIKKWKKASEIEWQGRKLEVENYKQEIERLKGLIEDLHYSSSVYDALADNYHPSKANDIALEKWQQFKKDNQL